MNSEILLRRLSQIRDCMDDEPEDAMVEMDTLLEDLEDESDDCADCGAV